MSRRVFVAVAALGAGGCGAVTAQRAVEGDVVVSRACRFSVGDADVSRLTFAGDLAWDQERNAADRALLAELVLRFERGPERRLAAEIVLTSRADAGGPVRVHVEHRQDAFGCTRLLDG